MKKLLSLTLALLMIISAGSFAFAKNHDKKLRGNNNKYTVKVEQNFNQDDYDKDNPGNNYDRLKDLENEIEILALNIQEDYEAGKNSELYEELINLLEDLKTEKDLDQETIELYEEKFEKLMEDHDLYKSKEREEYAQDKSDLPYGLSKKDELPKGLKDREDLPYGLKKRVQEENSTESTMDLKETSDDDTLDEDKDDTEATDNDIAEVINVEETADESSDEINTKEEAKKDLDRVISILEYFSDNLGDNLFERLAKSLKDIKGLLSQ